MDTLQVLNLRKMKNISAGVWRNPHNTQAEPCFGFCLVRLANSGLPRNYTGGTQYWVSPDPPVLKKLAVRDFDPRDDFQIFQKLLKAKLKHITD